MQTHDVDFELNERLNFHSTNVNNHINRDSLLGLFSKSKPNRKSVWYHGNAGNHYSMFIYSTLLDNAQIAKLSLSKAIEDMKDSIENLEQDDSGIISFALYLSSITKNKYWSISLAERLLNLKTEHGRYFNGEKIYLLISAIWLEDKKLVNTYLKAVVKDENRKSSLLLNGTSNAISSFLIKNSDQTRKAFEEMLAHHCRRAKSSRSHIYGSVDIFLPVIPNVLCSLFEDRGMGLKNDITNKTQNLTFSTFSPMDYSYLSSKDKFSKEVNLLWSDDQFLFT